LDNNQIKVSIIGAGNVAWHLAKALFDAGVNVMDIYSRTLENAKDLANSVQANVVSDIGMLSADIDLIFIAVQDDAITNVSSKIPKGDHIVCHTAGTKAMDIIDDIHTNVGVFYPLQTFSKVKNVDFSKVPICLEANDEKTLRKIEEIAGMISSNVFRINSEERRKLHIGAVFVSNFVNYMYTIAHDFIGLDNLSMDILKPLIMETAEKVMTHAPDKVQTGPAKRNDLSVIENHLGELELQDDKSFYTVYKLLTGLIQNRHNLDKKI
jgi:predicted short-subunit dehydrogenase-like oxidoreductase (DUF2520 family)